MSSEGLEISSPIVLLRDRGGSAVSSCSKRAGIAKGDSFSPC